jgi:hypothetical protein
VKIELKWQPDEVESTFENHFVRSYGPHLCQLLLGFGMVDFLWYRQIRADNFDVIIRIFVGRKVRIVFIVEYSSACTSGCMHNFFPIPSVSCVMHVLDDFSFLGDFLGGDSDLFSGSGGTLVVS